MIITPLALDGAYSIRPEPVADDRGHFARSFCSREFARAGLVTEFPQHSLSYNVARATLRGMHYQSAPFDEVKVVRCSRGSIHDVIVDLRPDSATFAHWVAVELSADNSVSLYVPGGFAHGFISLVPGSEVHYMISRNYEPGRGRALRWNDADLAIQWPLQPIVMSAADRNAPTLRDFISGNAS